MVRRRSLAIPAAALVAAVAACSGTSIIDPSKPDFAVGSHAQEEFQPLRAKWERGDRQTRLDLAPRLRRHTLVHERDPTSRTAKAMLALIAVATGDLPEVHALAQPLMDADHPGVTNDMATVAEGAAIRLEGNPIGCLKLLEPLFGKVLDPFARDILNEQLALAAVDVGSTDPKQYENAVRYMRGWIAQTAPAERDAVERKTIALLSRIPKGPLVDLVASVKGTDEMGSPWLLLVGERLASLAIELNDTDLAKFLIAEARGILGEKFDEVARIAVKDTGIRLESNTVGLLLSLRTDEHQRRDLEIGKGLALALGLPGSEAHIVSRDDQGKVDKIEEALGLLNADGAAVIIAGVDQEEADRAKAYGEKKRVPIILLRVPSTPVDPDGPVFVLGEDPTIVDTALLRAMAARGVERAAVIEGMRAESDVPMRVDALDIVGVHHCGASLDFIGAQKAKGILVDAGPTCTRESLKVIPGVIVALGLDGPLDVPAQFRAAAGLYPVDSATAKDAGVVQYAALGRGPPSWWAGLGHDAGLLAWAAVQKLPKTKPADEKAIEERGALVTQRLKDATGALWTTEAMGFSGGRVLARTVRVVAQ